MIKASFAVGYQSFKGESSNIIVVLGVTSIVPNLNGVLFFTEDRENHFIESCDMNEVLGNMFISYEEDLDEYKDYTIIDHRK